MEAASGSAPADRDSGGAAEVRVRRETLRAVLDHCQRALEMLGPADASAAAAIDEEAGVGASPNSVERETDELCSLLKSKVESEDFLGKLGSIDMSVYHNCPDDSLSWDMVSATDLWEDKNLDGNCESDDDGYVLVRQEDIVEGIACFMAAYLLSMKHTKELTPNQLQEALGKTFSLKKKKSKLRKAWDGSKVVYNVASWSATAIGIYQNPALYRAATVAFWSSCRVISKLF